MEIKQKEAFCPMFIKHFKMQRISKYARETWEFVNLYSKTRGINRFKALLRAFELLKVRPEVIARDMKFINMTPIKEWVKNESKLGNPTLIKHAEEVKNEIVDLTLAWSIEVNKIISEMVFDIPPFPYVKESLNKMKSNADLMVVSQTPVEALIREWEEHNIQNYVSIIAGQEYGTKAEHIKFAAKGKYDDDKILMIGDAPGDQSAAKSNGVLFYPINPGHEDESWKRFYEEALDKFFSGTYAGEYENSLIEEFERYLPENPIWKY